MHQLNLLLFQLFLVFVAIVEGLLWIRWILYSLLLFPIVHTEYNWAAVAGLRFLTGAEYPWLAVISGVPVIVFGGPIGGALIGGGAMEEGGGTEELVERGINGVALTGGGANPGLLLGKGEEETGGGARVEDEGVKGWTPPANGVVVFTGAEVCCCCGIPAFWLVAYKWENDKSKYMFKKRIKMRTCRRITWIHQ